MRQRAIRAATCAILALLTAGGAARAQDAAAGKATYEKWCAGCHGVDGKGDGPAADRMLPRPRDFTSGLFQIRSTASGALPTDDDLMKVVEVGMPGTAMPGWKGHLGEADRRNVVAYLKSFYPLFAKQPAPEPIDAGKAPGGGEEAIADGRQLYEKIECWKCHGRAGRGDGPSAPKLEDDQDRPIRAADLTENWNFNGGGSLEDIHERLVTGLNGTPMPSFVDLIEADFMTAEQLWHVARYVRSLSPEKAPQVREVVRAARVEGSLPSKVDDPAWGDVERFYVPLVGQVIERPRWFAPTVDGVWVQALHDDESVVLRLTWHDPSKSPDPAWDEWTRRLVEAVYTDAAEGADRPDGVEAADSAAAPSGAAPEAPSEVRYDLPDQLAVQFPRSIPSGMERPYFLMGSADDPVYLWLWKNGAAPTEASGKGLDEIQPLSGKSALAAQAVFDEGEWRLLLRRSLAGGGGDRLTFEAGKAIPMVLYAWDGSNAESGRRAAISTWYFLYLDQPGGNAVFVAPLVVTLLTAALGVVIVARAQRRAAKGATDVGDEPERRRT